MNRTIAINDGNFETEVINSKIPVLVDFWAEWCGPCRAVALALEEIAEDFQGRLKVVKLNVDENPRTARDLGIRSIPTLMLYKDGVVAESIIGAMPKQKIADILDSMLGLEKTA